MLRLIKLAKLPLPLCQYPVKEGGRTVAVLDFAYPELRLAIETDGYRYHSSPSDLERDVSRANAINRLGWRLLRFTRNQVVECPEEVVAAIRQAVAAGRLAERGKRLPAERGKRLPAERASDSRPSGASDSRPLRSQAPPCGRAAP